MKKNNMTWKRIHGIFLLAVFSSFLFFKMAMDNFHFVSDRIWSTSGTYNSIAVFYSELQESLYEGGISLRFKDISNSSIEVDLIVEENMYFVTLSLGFDKYFPERK